MAIICAHVAGEWERRVRALRPMDRVRRRNRIIQLEAQQQVRLLELWENEGYIVGGVGAGIKQRPRAPFRTDPVNCLPGLAQGFPLFRYREGKVTIETTRKGLLGVCECVNKAVNSAQDAAHKCVHCISSGTVQMTYDRYLYGRLRGDTLFQERNGKLLMTMRNKAYRYLAEFDTSEYTSEMIADIVERTVLAAYTPSARQLKRVALLKHKAVSSSVAAFNKYLG